MFSQIVHQNFQTVLETACDLLDYLLSYLLSLIQCSMIAFPTEAAFTLLLYCELLQWEDRPLREFLHYPSQSEWQRKEGLCRKIIHYFNKGKVCQLLLSSSSFLPFS